MLSPLRGNSAATAPQASAKPILVQFSGNLQPLFIRAPKTITFNDSPYQVTATDQFLCIDSTLGAVQIILEAAPANGKPLWIKRITIEGNQLTVTRNGKNIEGAAQDIVDAGGALVAWNLWFDNTNASWWIA